jgi:hypothetical protein
MVNLRECCGFKVFHRSACSAALDNSAGRISMTFYNAPVPDIMPTTGNMMPAPVDLFTGKATRQKQKTANRW